MNREMWIAIAALGVAGGALAFITLGGIEDDIVYFLDAKELIEQGASNDGARVRLGGVVQMGSVDSNEDTQDLNFNVGMTESGEPSIAVHYVGAPEMMFKEGIGVVVEGTYSSGRMEADRILIKHNEEYRAPEEGEKPEQIYKTLVEDS